jgi:hypothetical protein
MIYRRPSLGKQQFIFSVVAAGTGAILAGGACADSMVPVPTTDVATDDATEDVQVSSSGSASGGFIGVTGSVSGSSSGSPGCVGPLIGSGSGGCFMMLFDANSDAIENLDTGSDQDVAVSDGSSDAADETSDGGGEAGDP